MNTNEADFGIYSWIGGFQMRRQLLEVTEVMEYLNVSRSTMDKLLHSRDFPSFKLFGKWKIDAALLEKWVAEQLTMKKPGL